jgi:hypothetical protein
MITHNGISQHLNSAKIRNLPQHLPHHILFHRPQQKRPLHRASDRMVNSGFRGDGNGPLLNLGYFPVNGIFKINSLL